METIKATLFDGNICLNWLDMNQDRMKSWQSWLCKFFLIQIVYRIAREKLKNQAIKLDINFSWLFIDKMHLNLDLSLVSALARINVFKNWVQLGLAGRYVPSGK